MYVLITRKKATSFLSSCLLVVVVVVVVFYFILFFYYDDYFFFFPQRLTTMVKDEVVQMKEKASHLLGWFQGSSPISSLRDELLAIPYLAPIFWLWIFFFQVSSFA